MRFAVSSDGSSPSRIVSIEIRPASTEVEGHEDFVRVEVVVFQGTGFEAVLLEAEGLVEADGREVGADDGELNLFDFWASGVEDCLDQQARGAGAAVGGTDVHGAEPAFVGIFAAGKETEGGDADEMGTIEDAEDLGVADPGGVFFEWSGAFVFDGAAEGFGIEAEAFETDFTEGVDVFWEELADGEGHDWKYIR